MLTSELLEVAEVEFVDNLQVDIKIFDNPKIRPCDISNSH